MASLQDLRKFMERQDVRSDAYWRSVLSSDARNIFPKYQLAKIQIAKNKVSKIRLIMENLPQFLIIQSYAKNRENIAKSLPQKQLKKQIESLVKDLELCRNQHRSSDYQFEILQHKGKVDYFCQELAKKKISPEIRQLIDRCAKWKKYVDSAARSAQQYDGLLGEKDKADLAKNVSLSAVDDCMLAGVSGRIIQSRLSQEVMKHRLRILLENGVFECPQNDPWDKQWKLVLARLQNTQQTQEKSDYV